MVIRRVSDDGHGFVERLFIGDGDPYDVGSQLLLSAQGFRSSVPGRGELSLIISSEMLNC